MISNQPGPKDKDPSALVIIHELREDGSKKYLRPLVLRIFGGVSIGFSPTFVVGIFFWHFFFEPIRYFSGMLV